RDTRAYLGAQQRFKSGSLEPDDPYRIACVERLQTLDEQATSTVGGILWRAAQAILVQLAAFFIAAKMLFWIGGLGAISLFRLGRSFSIRFMRCPVNGEHRMVSSFTPKQKTIIWAGIVCLGLLGIVVPWKDRYGWSAGYSLLFLPSIQAKQVDLPTDIIHM